jgi:hypothetical protein
MDKLQILKYQHEELNKARQIVKEREEAIESLKNDPDSSIHTLLFTYEQDVILKNKNKSDIAYEGWEYNLCAKLTRLLDELKIKYTITNHGYVECHREVHIEWS